MSEFLKHCNKSLISSIAPFYILYCWSGFKTLACILIVLFNLSGHKELEMSVTETPKKTGAPQIVKLDKALKLVNFFLFAYVAVNGE